MPSAVPFMPGQIWSEGLCPGLTATGLDLVAPHSRKITEKLAPALCLYANFGEDRIFTHGTNKVICAPRSKLTLISLAAHEAVSEDWREGQRAVTAGVMLDAALIAALPDQDAEDFERFLRTRQARPGAHSIELSPLLDRLAKGLMRRTSASGWLERLHRQQLTLRFILEALRVIESDAPLFSKLDNTPCNGRMDDVAQCLAAPEGAIPSLPDLARMAGMSLSVLRRRFKDRFGETPIDFARRHRLEHAFDLLDGSDLPIAEVAWRAGYSDTANFTNAFRRHFVHKARSSS